jgi:hypothetical protein
MLARAHLLALSGAVAACGSQQEPPPPSKTSTMTTSPADPWAERASGRSDARVATYSFKVADPAGIVKLSDPTMPEAIGYSAASCVITIEFSALSASSELDFASEPVQSVLRESARSFARCYGTSRRDESAKSVKVSLAVAPSGQLTSTNAAAGDSKLAGCIADAAKK